MKELCKGNSFKNRLFEQIKFSGKSVNQIERELGYPRNAISNYKNGGEPSGTRLVELANYFHVSPEYLIGKESEVTSVNLKNISPQVFFENIDQNQKIEIGQMYQKWVISQVKHN